MDSLTHIALGACIGELFFEKGFGKKAMFWGALSQSIPDVDFIGSFFLNTPDSLLAHRGFTHSFLFALFVIPIFALLADYFHRPHNISTLKWLFFFGVELFVHLLLDVFNNYGIGWFEPFSHERFSFNSLYVVDLFFSIIPWIFFLRLLLLDRYHLKRKKLASIALAVPLVYLLSILLVKIYISNDVKNYLAFKHISYSQLIITPAPLQGFLWYIIVKEPNAFYLGYYSFFDKRYTLKFYHYFQHAELLQNISDHENLQKLIRFSQGFYIVRKQRKEIIFNDLRFGQVNGWVDSSQPFVFRYYLLHPVDQKLIIQKGRFSQLNISSLLTLYKRVIGD